MRNTWDRARWLDAQLMIARLFGQIADLPNDSARQNTFSLTRPPGRTSPPRVDLESVVDFAWPFVRFRCRPRSWVQMASSIWVTTFSAWIARASALHTRCSASPSLFSAATVRAWVRSNSRSASCSRAPSLAVASSACARAVSASLIRVSACRSLSSADSANALARASVSAARSWSSRIMLGRDRAPRRSVAERCRSRIARRSERGHPKGVLELL
jgi:hypothetical protein